MNEIFYSHSTPYYGPICAMASKSYDWDVRNIAKFSPKMAKKKQSFFDFFSIFSQTVHTIRTKASQKEKDLSRLLYRICGSGSFCGSPSSGMTHLGWEDIFGSTDNESDETWGEDKRWNQSDTNLSPFVHSQNDNGTQNIKLHVVCHVPSPLLTGNEQLLTSNINNL